METQRKIDNPGLLYEAFSKGSQATSVANVLKPILLAHKDYVLSQLAHGKPENYPHLAGQAYTIDLILRTLEGYIEEGEEAKVELQSKGGLQ